MDSTSKRSFFPFVALIATPGTGLVGLAYFVIVQVYIPQLLMIALVYGTPFFLIFEFFKLIAAVIALLISHLRSSEDAEKVKRWRHTLIMFRDGITSFYTVWGSQVAVIMSTAVITYSTSPFYLFCITTGASVFSFALQWLNTEMDLSQEMFCFFIAKTKLSYLNMYYSYVNLKIRGWNPITGESFNTANFCFDEKTELPAGYDISRENPRPEALHTIIKDKYEKTAKSGLTDAGKNMAKKWQAELGIRNMYFMTYGNWHILLEPFLKQEFVCRLIDLGESRPYYRVRCYRRVVIPLFSIELGGLHKETFDQYYRCEGDWYKEFGNLLGLIVEENFTICRKFEMDGLSRSYTLGEIIHCFMQSKKREHIDTEKKEPLSLEEGHAEEGHAEEGHPKREGEPVEPLQRFYKYELTGSPIWF